MLLAFFVPAVVYMADAVGTQTEAVIIRGIAVGVPLRRVVVRELTTGLVIGVALGLAFYPFVRVVWGEPDVAAAVALALFGSTATATLLRWRSRTGSTVSVATRPSAPARSRP